MEGGEVGLRYPLDARDVPLRMASEHQEEVSCVRREQVSWRRRPVSCEVVLSVIHEEESVTLRQQRNHEHEGGREEHQQHSDRRGRSYSWCVSRKAEAAAILEAGRRDAELREEAERRDTLTRQDMGGETPAREEVERGDAALRDIEGGDASMDSQINRREENEDAAQGNQGRDTAETKDNTQSTEYDTIDRSNDTSRHSFHEISPPLHPDPHPDPPYPALHARTPSLTRRWSHNAQVTAQARGSAYPTLHTPHLTPGTHKRSWLRGRSYSLSNISTEDLDASQNTSLHNATHKRGVIRMNSVPDYASMLPAPDPPPAGTPQPKVLHKTKSMEQLLAKGGKYLQRALPSFARLSGLRRAKSDWNLHTLDDLQQGGGSPGPASRRNSNSLRHCDSLENVCDGPPFTEQLENGLGELAFQGLRFLSHSPEPLRYLEC
ncbi:uncharacterized protein LOC126992907 isoform X1 [Eriocheir sinensis]|uniref:uncharacterized protein LOC126992907 isoform X1 n=1 Tax=Eriocheir sinensis TaxID=95602 RepID=UPI0021C6A7B8|nr:uncharacterized protein LOC126992907 isoform X1 [Eriocheir sinensis]